MVTRALTTLTLVVALSACAADVAKQSTPPSATDAPTAEPTPTATPIDIPQVFASRMLAITELRADISGTIQVGDNVGEYSGTLESAGSDTHERLVVTFADGTPRVSETIQEGDTAYELTDGIWIRTQLTGSDTGDAVNIETIMDAALRDPESLVPAGTEMVDGDRLLRLDIQDAPAIPADTLGFTDPTIAEFEATVAFLAEDDGSPAGFMVEATWVQGAEAVAGVVDLRYRYALGARDVTVTAPEDPWEFHTGAELGYRMALPIDWTGRHIPASGEVFAFDEYVGTIDDAVQVVKYPDLQGAPTAEDWYRASAQDLLRRFGAEPEVANVIFMPDGSEVRVMTLHYDDGPDQIFFQQAVVVRAAEAWDINWYSFAGNETQDGLTLLNMVTSFEPAN